MRVIVYVARLFGISAMMTVRHLTQSSVASMANIVFALHKEGRETV
jgi:hypothetical protein